MPPLQALALYLFVFLWSTGFVGAKFGLPYAEPLTALVMAGMFLVLSDVYLARGRNP